MARALLGVAVALPVVALLLVAAGWRPVVLRSDSMAPDAPAGRLQGDANATPDAGRVLLDTAVLRTVAVVPGLGAAVDDGSPVLLAGVALLLVGTIGLLFVERRSARRQDQAAQSPTPRLPTGTSGLDTRALALLATLEALAEDGMDLQTLEALGRARIGALLGLGGVEDSTAVAALDDGARFVVIAFADADADALGLVPVGSRRATEGRAAVAAWWDGIEHRVPAAVRAELEETLVAAVSPPTGEEAGVDPDGPVD